MIKKIIVIILLIAMMFLLCGCNINNTKINNTKAYIRVDEKTIVIDVDKYIGFSNGIVTVYGIDGKTYKTHYTNVVIVQDVKGR